MIKCIFGLSIFLSAYLIFYIQPMLAKKILPLLGGSSFIWIACILFFQAGLLLGYVYAYLLSKIQSTIKQGIVHLILMACSLAFLPLSVTYQVESINNVTSLTAIIMLSQTVLLPFVILSASSPLLQSWYCRIRHTPFPYYFYSISNIGSLLGLMVYPLLVEPLIGIQAQMLGWSWTFGVYLILLTGCLLLFCMKANVEVTNTAKVTTPPKTIGLWLFLTFLSSSLLLAISHFLTQEILNLPLLWILPLVLFLISFIVTFRTDKSYDRQFWGASWIIWVMSYAWLVVTKQQGGFPFVIVLSMLMYSGCMICHGELIRHRPEWVNLTHFYLIIALGGALGGVFINFIALPIFNEWWDFYFILLSISIVVIYAARSIQPSRPTKGHSIFFVASFLSIAGVLLVAYFQVASPDVNLVVKNRNHFGLVEVNDNFNRERQKTVRTFLHGNILHGLEELDSQADEAKTYYSAHSGIGLAIQYLQSKKDAVSIGVLGLGVGSLSFYGRENDQIHFYEIDKDVIEIAKKYFTFLSKSKADIHLYHNDARIALKQQLEENGSKQFDLLVADAFSGDVVPFQLLTLEAFQLYQAHLSKGGIIAFHISNAFLDLLPVTQALANQYQLPLHFVHSRKNASELVYATNWVLISQDKELANWLEARKGDSRVATYLKSKEMLWTDDKSSILQLINLTR